MKKVNNFLLGMIILPLLIVNVFAASVPYQWKVGDEKVNGGQSNEAGTARVEKDGKKVTLFLNNYNGKELELECYGTGQEGMEFIINLEGENTITSDDTGIDMDEAKSTKLKFEGTGKLTINAPKPISNEEGSGTKVIDLSSKEDTTTTGDTSDVSDSIEDTPQLISSKDDDKKLISEKDDDDDDNDWLVRGLGILVLISVGVITFLVVKLNQKNKNTVK